MMLLLDHGCDVDTPGARDGMTPLLHACNTPRPNMTLDVIIRLISRGADVNKCCNSSQNSPLHFAAKSGSIEIIRELLAAGANANAKNHLGVDAATIARQRNHIACAELIEQSLI